MIDRSVVLNERSSRKLGLVGGSFAIVEIEIIQQVACFSLLLLIANIPFSFSNYQHSTPNYHIAGSPYCLPAL